MKLSNKEIHRITNEACELLQKNANVGHTVLTFEECGDTIIPRLLVGKEANGKCDLFPRETDPSAEIYAHLGVLYGNPGEIFIFG